MLQSTIIEEDEGKKSGPALGLCYMSAIQHRLEDSVKVTINGKI